MVRLKPYPSAEAIRQILHYDPATGIFTWRTRRSIAVQAGAVAGRTTRGRIEITIGRRIFQAHRLAWLYVHGTLPDAWIDHKNLDATDNRIDNLRPASAGENAWNRGKVSGSSSSLKGATWRKESCGWSASIKCRGKSHYLGIFKTEQEAHEAYVAAAERMFGQFARSA